MIEVHSQISHSRRLKMLLIPFFINFHIFLVLFEDRESNEKEMKEKKDFTGVQVKRNNVEVSLNPKKTRPTTQPPFN